MRFFYAAVSSNGKTSEFGSENKGSIPFAAAKLADIAQLAEQLICNQLVVGSSPIVGSSI